MATHQPSRSSGFTILELLISMVLGLLVIGSMIALFTTGKRAYQDNDRLARLQENGRTALYFIADDLRHANFWGPVIQPSMLSIEYSSSGDCKTWGYDLSDDYVIGSDSPAAVVSAENLTCLNNIYDSGSAIVGIKRVSSGPVAWSNIANDEVFLRSNSVGGTLWKKGEVAGSGVATSAPGSVYSDWLYQPKIYFVGQNSNCDNSGAGTPTLCVIEGDSLLSTVLPLVEGVEVFHIEYGIDNDADGSPDAYQTQASSTAVTAKIYVLLQELSIDPFYTDTTSYVLGSKTVAAANDNYHRALFSTTVLLQNQRNL